MKKPVLTYAQVGDNYDTKDPVKKIAQAAAAGTAGNLTKHGFHEHAGSRGESAYVWQQGRTLMASVVEGLGTKNLVADAMRTITGQTYYDIIGHDTVATIINDLVSVGATPLVVHAYWAVEDNTWLADAARMTDLVRGWRDACNLAGAVWGGGETPTLKGIVVPGTAEFGGSAVGIIHGKNRLMNDSNLTAGDRILLLMSNGINANGLSLARAVAGKLPKGYATDIGKDKSFGAAILTKTNIYAGLLNALFNADIDIHYISNITGHGLRKLMRGRPNFIYVIEQIAKPQPVFSFIQKHANLSDYEMYQTYNMGMDYALYLPRADVLRAQGIITSCGFSALDAGHVEQGDRQVVIKPKQIVFSSETLKIRD